MTGPEYPKVILEGKKLNSELVLAEYDRIAALERARLEFMEKILQTYIAVVSAVVAGVLLILERGSVLGIPYSFTDALLTGLFLFGVVTLFRTVNSNIALMELA